MSALLALLVATAAPTPGELKTFRDWTVGCDNGLACQAVALMPEDNPEAVTMIVQRGPERDAPVRIGINPPEKKPAAVVVDGRRFELTEQMDSDQIETLRPRDTAGFLRAMLSAKNAEVVDGAGQRLAALSPNGASAALLYMDERQRRIGTVTALARPGAKPASAVPLAPAFPVVRQPPVSSKPARSLSTARLRQLLGREATVCEYANELSLEGGRLDAQHSLVLASHPCGNGAYNFSYSAFIIDERGRARPAQYDVSGEDGVLVNAGWNPEQRQLSSFSKGRGLGDCGTGQVFAWDGARFRLIEENAMGECRGSVDWISTWRAVVR